jgi:hypothetical protein
MTAPKPATPAFGFLTIVEQVELGLLGGLLVLNAAGRPLEFHCTAPLKPSRTQEILYGPTLRPYLCGEQIGQALIGKAKSELQLLFTDDPDLLGVREFASSPVLYVASQPSQPLPDSFLSLKLGASAAGLENRYSSDQPQVLSRWKEHGQTLDIVEPFGRIREALEEAQKTSRAA